MILSSWEKLSREAVNLLWFEVVLLTRSVVFLQYIFNSSETDRWMLTHSTFRNIQDQNQWINAVLSNQIIIKLLLYLVNSPMAALKVVDLLNPLKQPNNQLWHDHSYLACNWMKHAAIDTPLYFKLWLYGMKFLSPAILKAVHQHTAPKPWSLICNMLKRQVWRKALQSYLLLWGKVNYALHSLAELSSNTRLVQKTLYAYRYEEHLILWSSSYIVLSCISIHQK